MTHSLTNNNNSGFDGMLRTLVDFVSVGGLENMGFMAFTMIFGQKGQTKPTIFTTHLALS